MICELSLFVAPTQDRAIIYSVIARENVILVEETLTKGGRKIVGNFAHIATNLLPRFRTTDGKSTYLHGQYTFHVVRENDVKYVCMSDRDIKRRVVFAFLRETMETFVRQFGDTIVRALWRLIHYRIT